MPRLNYFSVAQKIADILRADPTLIGIPVDVEGEMNFVAGATPWIGVYTERRDPSPHQSLDAGQSTRYTVRFAVWCWTMSLNSTAEAIEQRDDLLSKVEVALMRNRKLDDMVDMSYLVGGELPSGRFTADNADSAVFLSGGEIILLADGLTSTV